MVLEITYVPRLGLVFLNRKQVVKINGVTSSTVMWDGIPHKVRIVARVLVAFVLFMEKSKFLSFFHCCTLNTTSTTQRSIVINSTGFSYVNKNFSSIPGIRYCYNDIQEILGI